MPKYAPASLLIVALFFLSSCTSQNSSGDVFSEQHSSSSVPEGLSRRTTPIDQPTSWVERYYERKAVKVDDFFVMLKENPSMVQDGQTYSFQGTIGAMFLHPATNNGEWTEIASAKEGSEEDVYAITLLGSNGNAVGCLTDQSHANEVAYGKNDVIFEGRIEAVGIEMSGVANEDFYQLHPCAFPGRVAHYPEDAQPTTEAIVQTNCIADLKRESFIFGFEISEFLETWDDVVQEINQGTTSTADIAARFGESVNSLQNGRSKLVAIISDDCPPEAKELAGLAFELETMARDFQGFFEGERMLGRVAVQMAKFEELSERLMGVFLRIQAL